MTKETHLPSEQTEPTPTGETQPTPSGTQGEAPSPEAATTPTAVAGPQPTAQGPASETPPQPEPPAEPKPESRVRRFLRRLLWTLLSLFVVFGAGFLTAWYGWRQPLYQQHMKMKSDLSQVTEQKAALEVQQADLEARLRDAQAQIADLETQLSDLQARSQRQKARVYVLSALADTYAAKLSLEMKETATTRLYLTNAKAALTLLGDLLPEQETALRELKGRIDQALGKLETNPLSAQGDMDVVTNGLVQLEKLLLQE